MAPGNLSTLFAKAMQLCDADNRVNVLITDTLAQHYIDGWLKLQVKLYRESHRFFVTGMVDGCWVIENTIPDKIIILCCDNVSSAFAARFEHGNAEEASDLVLQTLTNNNFGGHRYTRDVMDFIHPSRMIPLKRMEYEYRRVDAPNPLDILQQVAKRMKYTFESTQNQTQRFTRKIREYIESIPGGDAIFRVVDLDEFKDL